MPFALISTKAIDIFSLFMLLKCVFVGILSMDVWDGAMARLLLECNDREPEGIDGADKGLDLIFI